jgi:hypothetical protein
MHVTDVAVAQSLLSKQRLQQDKITRQSCCQPSYYHAFSLRRTTQVIDTSEFLEHTRHVCTLHFARNAPNNEAADVQTSVLPVPKVLTLRAVTIKRYDELEMSRSASGYNRRFCIVNSHNPRRQGSNTAIKYIDT